MKFNDPTKYLTVSALSSLLNEVLSSALPSLPFQGEISQLTRPASGHIYFTLKDQTSQISCVIWRSVASSLNFALESGSAVNCIGKPNIWGGNGKLQMVIQRIQPSGAGELQRLFLELKAKLEAEGLFSEERKREIPFLPRAVGVVTSGTGAVIHDIEVKIRERMPNQVVYLVPVRVQGEGAASEIVRAIKQLDKSGLVDVMIVGRGGGSLEDLWAFNEEEVVRAIFAASIPIISAVGHEVDVTLADLAADVRAPTPTAAAEMVVPQRDELIKELDWYAKRIGDLDRWFFPRVMEVEELEQKFVKLVSQNLERKQMALRTGEARLGLIEPTKILEILRNRIEAKFLRFESGTANNIKAKRNTLERCSGYFRMTVVEEKLPALRSRLQNLGKRISLAETNRQQAARERLLGLRRRLVLANPESIFSRGYSMVTSEAGVVQDASSLALDDVVNIKFYKGGVSAQVKNIIGENGKKN